ANSYSWDDPSGAQNLNPRRVVFLQPAMAKDGTRPLAGICPSGANAGKYYDPWGNTFRLRIDWDYNNSVTNPYIAGAGFNALGYGVIGYSVGKDRASGADNNNGSYKV